MADRIGQQLGNYRLVRLLGRGGFAEVYLGEHLHLKTQAAIKVLHASLEEDDEEGFLREAQTVARLRHPHIVRVFDFDVENHTPFLVMDYLPNGNIRRSHPKGTPLPLVTIVSYVKQIASALQYAHDEKLIHRDIKPENMLLDKGNTVVLSDFGIALMAQSSRYQSTQEVAGTAAYMAPEQFQGKPRRASDQYALGVAVYEWLIGDRPFHGSFSEIASQHLFVPPPPLREKASTISPAVEQVVLTALEKDPQKRFANVQAFATALEQACKADQPHSPILSQAPTVASQPLHTLTMTSPAMLPSQQTVMSSLDEGVQTPLTYPDQSHQVSGTSGTLKPRSSHQSISRRTFLGGLAGLVVVGGGATWLVLHRVGYFPLYTYHGHTNGVNAVAWSPDGKRIASGSHDNTVQVWDAIDAGNIYTYRTGNDNGVDAVAWSPDGKRIASWGAGGGLYRLDFNLQVWNAIDGGNRHTYPNYFGGAWSPDGTRIASANVDGTVQILDASNGNIIYSC